MFDGSSILYATSLGLRPSQASQETPFRLLATQSTAQQPRCGRAVPRHTQCCRRMLSGEC